MTVCFLEKDVQAIGDYQSDDYAEWFERGFRLLNSKDGDKVGRIFAPLHNLLALAPSHVEGLEGIYRALSNETNAKQQFRKGLAVAFSRLADSYKDNPNALGEVLLLGQLIQASEIVPRLLSTFTTIGASANNGILLRQALGYLASFSSHDEAARIIHDLLTLADAPPDSAIFGWLTMCRYDPARWSKHLDDLRGRISLALKDYTGPNTSVTAMRFAANVPLPEVTAQLYLLRYSRNHLLSKDADNWLLDSLVNDENSPYVVLRDQEGYLYLNGRHADIRLCKPIVDAEDMNSDTCWFLSRASIEMVPPTNNEEHSPRPEIADDLSILDRLCGWIRGKEELIPEGAG
ncbi:MAG: hypothetical protein WAW10_11545 [Gallionella sp.]